MVISNMQYILIYSKHEQAVYLVFSRGVFSTLPSISDEAFVNIVNDFQSLTNFAKSSILNVWQGSASAEAATEGVKKGALGNLAKFTRKHLCVPESPF